MDRQKTFQIGVSILVCIVLQAQGADKYTDENKPYEFGFEVEVNGSKQQHRHEKKDKDGIIMGEFGFVTADDVYHVTVYATDKEGRFKILSMKNIHLKSTQTTPTKSVPNRQGHSLALPSAPPAQANAISQAIPTKKPQTTFKPVSLEPPIRSCSSCSIPTTSTRAPPPAPVNVAHQNQPTLPASTPALSSNVQGGSASQPAHPQHGLSNYQPQGSPNYAQQGSPNSPQQGLPNYSQQVSPNYPQQGSNSANLPTYPHQPDYPVSSSIAQLPNPPNNFAQSNHSPSLGQDHPASAPESNLQPVLSKNPQHGGQGKSNGLSPVQSSYPQGGAPVRNPKQYTGQEQQFGARPNPSSPQRPGSIQGGQRGFDKPTLVSAQMQIVDKDTDIHTLRSGEERGLPNGISENDMSQLLYTFNYTVGFHGHFEEGYTNGVKKGYYFVTARNGIKTRIDYVADDTGFHPKVSQEVLDLLSDDVPKPETEKDDKYGLKGYEFKWLYYPVETKRH